MISVTAGLLEITATLPGNAYSQVRRRSSIRPTGELLAQRGDVRTLSELKHLSVAEASARRHVSVRGVVTYLDPSWGLLFIQDRTAAAFVSVRSLNLQLKPGDEVNVSGVSGPGDYAPLSRNRPSAPSGTVRFPCRSAWIQCREIWLWWILLGVGCAASSTRRRSWMDTQISG